MLRDLAGDGLGAGLRVGAELVGLLRREAPAVLFLLAQVGDERPELLELLAGLLGGGLVGLGDRRLDAVVDDLRGRR